jgi:poly-gamma-glutamate synthesis protein (capsule biosynthesis protein)
MTTSRLVFLGDLMLGGDVSMELARRSPTWFWGDVLSVLSDSDAVIANLESPLTTRKARWNRTLKWFHFRADPASVEILKCGNVRFVCLANNHMLDFRETGLADTLRHLDAAAISHAGAGMNSEEAAAPALLELPEIRVGFFAATDGMPEFSAAAQRPGTNIMRFEAGGESIGHAETAIRALRDAGADLIILSFHWGFNLKLAPPRKFREFAHAAVDAGADIIHGHSAHVFQAIERYRHGLILYDTGNFIDDYWKIPFRRTSWSFAFVLEINCKRLDRLRLLPVQTHPMPPMKATGETFEKMCRRMRSLSRSFGTTIFETEEGLTVPLGAGADSPAPTAHAYGVTDDSMSEAGTK